MIQESRNHFMVKQYVARLILIMAVAIIVPITGCGEKGSEPDPENSGQVGDPASGGKTPSDKTFRDGVDIRNLPGASVIGDTATMTVYLADKYGRYSGLPEGLTVHAASENGIATNTNEAAVDNEGRVSFTLRTQGEPDDVGAASWVSTLETTLRNYSWPGGSPSWSGYPGKGVVSVLYYTRGEEEFVDANNNGQKDSGETFMDTPVDPFVDSNSNGTWDIGEEYVDTDGNGAYTSVNGRWDSNKMIFRNTKMLVTGSPHLGLFPATLSIPSGGTAVFFVVVCDDNYNRISSGSTITVTATDGLTIIGGEESVTLPTTAATGTSATSQLALIQNQLTLQHATGGTGTPSFTVAITWKKGDDTETITRKFSPTVTP
ncbi:MAG: hypothetical protein MI742_00020 [Desulfobacterales bacterium]|nr:hypothetical protein [Desulfobacterales bacterium]